jgi:pimeloyl-ACP methyl ester carboxylesterase
MRSLIVAVAALLAMSWGIAAAQPTGSAAAAAPSLNAEAAKSFADFQAFGPHRAFVTGASGKASWFAGVGGPDPGNAVTSTLKRCEERGQQPCTLHVVNNYTVTGRPWRELVPARAVDAPDIGRLRAEPYWSMRGPQLADGLIVWSHGYMAGKNSTESAPQSWIGRFTRLGYDLYRFDREWIADWASDATTLAAAVRKAREMGYRRVVLAGQSAGAWVSLAALARGAPVDGVISIAAAHHGTVDKMRDTTRARSEWQHVIEALKPGPKVVLVNFADDAYDVGGRMADARAIFAKSGVGAAIIDDPAGFKGHGAGADSAFARKFGPCIQAFIESGTKHSPC